MTTDTVLPARVVISPEALFQTMEGNAVWLEINDGSYFSADAIGLRLWQLFSDHEDVETVVRAMLDEYDVDELTLRRDMAVFIQNLVGANLISVA